jgi:hypothetical protein
VLISSAANTKTPSANINASSAPDKSQIAKQPDTTFAQTHERNECSDAHVSRKPFHDQIQRHFSRVKNSIYVSPK